MGSAPTLSQPPPQPPNVTGQQGQSPYAGSAAMMQSKLQQGQGGEVNPRGALLQMGDGIKKVLDQMAKMESAFAPFADRIRSLIDAGIGAINSGGPPGTQPKDRETTGAESMKPDQSEGFPG